MNEPIDISRVIDKTTTVWPGNHNTLHISSPKSFRDGDTFQISRIEMGLHTGTHIDAPKHHLSTGNTIDQYPLSRFYGICRIIDLTDISPLVHGYHLETYFKARTPPIILLKTKKRNIYKFSKNYTSLDISGAELLIKNNISMIGTDTLSIEAFDTPESVVHKKLLLNDIVILENLNLAEDLPGAYTLYCFPIKINKTEAAPCRAILYPLKKENYNA